MKKLILLLALLQQLWHLSAQSAIPILDRRVTVKSTNQPIGKVLNIISETAGFNFSYGTQIKVNGLVTVHAENRTVREVLDQIFKNEVTYQQIGNHLILQKKVVPKNNTKIQENTTKPAKYDFIITGYIRDLHSGNGLRNVSIYNKSSLSSALSGDFGYYQLNVTSKESPIFISYSLNEYSDTTVSIAYENNGLSEINMNLRSNTPMPEMDLNTVITNDTVTDKPQIRDSVAAVKTDSAKAKLAWPAVPFKKIKVSETQFGQWFINKYQRLSETNIHDSFHRDWQFTVIPPIGSNGRLSGLVTNRLSVNLLIGYNGGVDGAEFGGLLNIIKNDINGVQFSGFGNMTGGHVNGAQFAGFFNHTLGNVNGFQGAGFYNFNHGFTTGVQGAGFVNVNLRNLEGMQAAGFMNINGGDLTGAQGAGFMNISGGFINGIQGAGFMNINGGGIDGAQGAGFMNICGSGIRGVQAAGFMNIAQNIEGAQIAGFINIAGRVKGAQIGFINIADSMEGAAIGIINFIKNGLHQLEISSNENNYGLAYRSGTRRLYSTLFVNSNLPVSDSNTLMSYGWGLGTSVKLGKPLYLTLDATTQHLTFNFISNHLNLQSKLSASLEFRLFKGCAVFGGASLNHLVSDTRDPHFASTFANYGTKSIFHAGGTYDQHMWVGYQFGVRLF